METERSSVTFDGNCPLTHRPNRPNLKFVIIRVVKIGESLGMLVVWWFRSFPFHAPFTD